MKNHIVLCGLGKVGISILETLHHQNQTVVVIAREVHPDWERRAKRLAARLIIADARDEEVLVEAGAAPTPRSTVDRRVHPH